MMHAKQTDSTPRRQKSNKRFMILSALGILFVIDAHCGAKSGLNRIFPYDSFFMPMFVFISGYFFRRDSLSSLKSLIAFAAKKVRTLLLPYFGWIAFYGLVTAGLTKLGILNLPLPDYKTLLNSIAYYGISFGFNDPAWFIPTLFLVNILYAAVRWLFQKCWNDKIAMPAYWILGTSAVYSAANGLFGSQISVLIERLFFFLQFFQLGIIFRKYFESKFDSANTAATLLLCIMINAVLLLIYGSGIAFPNCAFMSGFTAIPPFLPFVTSITGIAFCLKIAKALVPIWGDNKLVNFISNNTFFIMTHHLLAKAMANGILWLCIARGNAAHPLIDLKEIQSNAWYVCPYEYESLASLFMTVLICLSMCALYNGVKAKIFKLNQRA